jgi:hypothetical protein
MNVPRQPDQDFLLFPFTGRRVTLLDGAYACYAFIGLAMVAIIAVSTLVAGETQEGYGMLLGSLLGLPLLIAFVTAIVPHLASGPPAVSQANVRRWINQPIDYLFA